MKRGQTGRSEASSFGGESGQAFVPVPLFTDNLCARAIRHRWLIYTFVARDLKLRYSGSALGVLWTLLNPLLFMLVYTLVFSVYFRMVKENYPVFLLSGLLPWIWFSESVQFGTTSILAGGGYIGRTMFPAEVLPIVAVLSPMMNFLFSLPMLALFIAGFRVHVGWPLLALPVVMLVQFVISLGIVLFTATYTVFFRDLAYLITHLLMLCMFLVPILYPLTNVPEPLRPIVASNPLAVLVISYQAIFFHNLWPDFRMLLGAAACGMALMWLGRRVFERHKDAFAEYL